MFVPLRNQHQQINVFFLIYFPPKLVSTARQHCYNNAAAKVLVSQYVSMTDPEISAGYIYEKN